MLVIQNSKISEQQSAIPAQSHPAWCCRFQLKREERDRRKKGAESLAGSLAQSQEPLLRSTACPCNQFGQCQVPSSPRTVPVCPQRPRDLDRLQRQHKQIFLRSPARTLGTLYVFANTYNVRADEKTEHRVCRRSLSERKKYSDWSTGIKIKMHGRRLLSPVAEAAGQLVMFCFLAVTSLQSRTCLLAGCVHHATKYERSDL